MNVLEKILEELENESQLAHEEMRRCARGNPLQFDEVKGYARAMEYVVDTIRSHMDDIPNCGDCSRRKWYQKGFEDGKKDKDWISAEDRLPEDDDMRFYMCIVENHEEDLPMFCQYDGEYGFGFWHDIYDSESLGFVDTVFKTNDELGYEKVVAWQPLPEPYKEE